MDNKPNAAEALTPDAEDELWRSGALGMDTPEQLLRSVWFVFNKTFGWRACNEASQLKLGDIVHKVTTKTRQPYYVWLPRSQKCDQGDADNERVFQHRLFPNVVNTDRCFYKIVSTYLEKRNTPNITIDSFFVSSNRNFGKGKACSTSWYINSSVGAHKFEGFMKTMANIAGLEGRFTNHASKKTCGQNLKQLGLDNNFASNFTNHKDPSSLEQYGTVSIDQQMAVNQLLQNPGTFLPKFDVANPMGTLPIGNRQPQPSTSKQAPRHVSSYVNPNSNAIEMQGNSVVIDGINYLIKY